MKKLEEGLDFLQRQEEKLWFLGMDRAEDWLFCRVLKEAGLKLDRRTEFPRKSTSVSLAPERQVPALSWGRCAAGSPNPSKWLAASRRRLILAFVRTPRLPLWPNCLLLFLLDLFSILRA